MTKEIDRAIELHASHWLNTKAPIRLADHKGKVIAIEAFQMLCPGCVSHGLPQAQRITEVFPSSEVLVLGLHTVFEHHEAQGSPTALKAFLHEYQIQFPVAIDAPSVNGSYPKTMTNLELRGTPSLILLDRNGLLREKFFGTLDDLALGARIMQLVSESDNRKQPLKQIQEKSQNQDCDENTCSK